MLEIATRSQKKSMSEVKEIKENKKRKFDEADNDEDRKEREQFVKRTEREYLRLNQPKKLLRDDYRAHRGLWKLLYLYFPRLASEILDTIIHFIFKAMPDGHIFEPFDVHDFGILTDRVASTMTIGVFYPLSPIWISGKGYAFTSYDYSMGRKEHEICLAFQDHQLWWGNDVKEKHGSGYSLENIIRRLTPAAEFKIKASNPDLRAHLIGKAKMVYDKTTFRGKVKCSQYGMKCVLHGTFIGLTRGFNTMETHGYMVVPACDDIATPRTFYGTNGRNKLSIHNPMDVVFEGFALTNSTVTLSDFTKAADLIFHDPLDQEDHITIYKYKSITYAAPYEHGNGEKKQWVYTVNDISSPNLLLTTYNHYIKEPFDERFGLLLVLKKVFATLGTVSQKGKEKLMKIYPQEPAIQHLKVIGDNCGFFDVCMASGFHYKGYFDLLSAIRRYVL